jgi:uncharacterized damage-inducible protein DinB
MDNPAESTLVELIRYSNWANAQVLAACQDLTDEQLDTGTPGSYGSIRDTLMHMLWAEADYVGRMTGDRPWPAFKREERPTLAGLAEFAGRVASALLDAVQRVPVTQIVHEEEDGEFLDYQARHLFMQAVNHGIEHRTNVTTILSSLGIPVPEIDNWGYLFAHPDRFELKQS